MASTPSLDKLSRDTTFTRPGSLLFQLDELDGSGAAPLGATAGASQRQLARRLAALAPARAGSAAAAFYERLRADAERALLSAAAEGGESAGTATATAAPAPAAAVAPRLLAALSAAGHEAWLRTGRARTAAAQGGGGGGESSNGHSGGGGSSGALHAGHTFIVVRPPADAAAAASGGGAGSAGGGAPRPPPTPLARDSADTVASGSDAGAGFYGSGLACATAAATAAAAPPLLIVDLDFSAPFRAALAEASDADYSALLNALPPVVVGGAGGVAALVAFLCERMERAFAQSGTPLPPWRETRHMLGIWFPSAADDAPPAPGAGGLAAAGAL